MGVGKWDLIKTAEQHQSTAIFPSPPKHTSNESIAAQSENFILRLKLALFYRAVHYRVPKGSLLV